ncbi:MAG: class I SAM-dependent methyltransferase [Nitrospirae bacterium]|nr:class I SAM-dependent methyltransferase [Nitrospirota bacterium]
MNEREYKKMSEVEESHWWYIGLHRLILRYIRREYEKSGPPLEILDAGCGTGRLCQLMSDFGKVQGLDISETAIALCRKRVINRVYQADLNNVDLGKERFDIITSIDVLYHKAVRDDALIIGKMYDALRPGGFLILNLPAYDFLKGGHDIAVHTERRYTKSALNRMLTSSGFIVEKASYRIAFLFLPVALYRLARKPFLHVRNQNNQLSDVSKPPAIVNKLLLRLNVYENSLMEKYSLPFGTSVFVLARKPLS